MELNPVITSSRFAVVSSVYSVSRVPDTPPSMNLQMFAYLNIWYSLISLSSQAQA